MFNSEIRTTNPIVFDQERRLQGNDDRDIYHIDHKAKKLLDYTHI